MPRLTLKPLTRTIIRRVIIVTSLVGFTLSASAVAASTSVSVSNTTDTSVTSTSSTSTTADSTTTVSANRMATVKAAADKEIERRLGQLSKLDSLISQTTKLSSTDQASLTSQVNSETSGLTSLEVKINADTDGTTLKTDVQSVITGYRVYALITPKVWLVYTADGQQQVEAKLTTLTGKLQTRLTAAQTAGQDVTALETDLTNMNSEISASQSISSSIETSVIPLQPTDYDSNHSVLSGDNAQLKTAHQDNVDALNNAQTIVAGLKNL